MVLIMELIENIAETHGSVSIFGGVSEWTREVNDFHVEIKESKVINKQNISKSKVVIVYDHMNESLRAMFSELARSLNRKSYRFMVHWLDRWSNRYWTDDVIKIYFIILYLIKNS